jgi:glycosyltransferase 2 family protein
LDKQTAVALVKLLTGLVLIFLIARQIELGKLGARLLHADLFSFAVACLALACAVVVNALRWCEVTAHLGHPLSQKQAISGYFEAMFFNQILPTGLGGDAVRALRAVEAGSSIGFATLGVLIDRGYGILSVAVIVLFAAVVGGSPVTASPIFIVLELVSLVIVAGAAVVIAIGSFVVPDRLPGFVRPLGWSMQWFSSCTRDFRIAARILLLLIVGNALSICSIWLCARSMGVGLSLWDALVFTQAFALSAIIPLSIGGWGVREVVAIRLLQPLQVSATDATAISVAFGLALTIFALIGATGWMLASYRRIRTTQAPT